ncbi:glycosyltransferase family 2 protein [Alicyclobacillus sp. ALC3]|uniref:glycosyltransferase family 2 protein n=1 Tax=Alicyclobacillus sp. ALC3 TaxID=2796143 RepID=UPI00237997C7|nr:glycosyltransferase family 2 protein [Alicyclobacillus sp. ALC3]WDL99005.1 glycosyltransferase family 2 protein [Alicyclobacillus sp. ALC3]
MTTLITAVIPAHNEAGYVGQVLHQLVRAGVSHCVIVANGCTDDTVREVKSAHSLFRSVTIVDLPVPLGPDVGRAVGAIAALRLNPKPDWLVFVDADWQGAFGPLLADFLAVGIRGEKRVLFVGQREITRLDQRLWQAALHQVRADLFGLQPSLLPLLIRRSAFQMLSPRWLAHPGQFAALCVTHLLARDVGVYVDWEPRVVGNRQRGWSHDHAMRDLLLGDAIEGIGLLDGKRQIRAWQGQLLDGGHSSRRYDLLDRWANALTIGEAASLQEVTLAQDLV